MRIIKVLFNLVELPLFIDNTGPNRAKCTRTYVRVHMYMYILHINPNTCLFLQKLYRTLVRYDVINIRGARHFKLFPFFIRSSESLQNSQPGLPSEGFEDRFPQENTS